MESFPHVASISSQTFLYLQFTYNVYKFCQVCGKFFYWVKDNQLPLGSINNRNFLICQTKCRVKTIPTKRIGIKTFKRIIRWQLTLLQYVLLVYDNCPYQCPKPYLSYHTQKKNNRWSIVYEKYQKLYFLKEEKSEFQNVENGN